jgi:uncharacterized LabA/DUF88 family protein
MNPIATQAKPSRKVSSQKSSRPRFGSVNGLAQSELSDFPDDLDDYSYNPFDRGRVAVFIDGANLFYAASHLGIEIDYSKLLQRLVGKARLLHAFFYTGVDPDNDKQHKFLLWMQRSGFRVISKNITQFPDGSRKANLDVEIAVDMMRLAEHFDTAILVSGDGDFAYVVNTLAYQGIRVEVVGLRCMTSDHLISVADCYIDVHSIKHEVQKLNSLEDSYSPPPAICSTSSIV